MGEIAPKGCQKVGAKPGRRPTRTEPKTNVYARDQLDLGPESTKLG